MSQCIQCSGNIKCDDVMEKMKTLVRIYSETPDSKSKHSLLMKLCSKSCSNEKSGLVNCVSLSGRTWCSSCIAFLINAPEASWKRVSYVMFL